VHRCCIGKDGLPSAWAAGYSSLYSLHQNQVNIISRPTQTCTLRTVVNIIGIMKGEHLRSVAVYSTSQFYEFFAKPSFSCPVNKLLYLII